MAAIKRELIAVEKEITAVRQGREPLNSIESIIPGMLICVLFDEGFYTSRVICVDDDKKVAIRTLCDGKSYMLPSAKCAWRICAEVIDDIPEANPRSEPRIDP